MTKYQMVATFDSNDEGADDVARHVPRILTDEHLVENLEFKVISEHNDDVAFMVEGTPLADISDEDTVVVESHEETEHKVEKHGIPVYLPDGNRFARAVISDEGHYVELFLSGDAPIAGLLAEGLIGFNVVYISQEAAEAVHSATTQGEQQ